MRSVSLPLVRSMAKSRELSAPLEWALRDLRRREDIVEFIEAHDLTV